MKLSAERITRPKGRQTRTRLSLDPAHIASRQGEWTEEEYLELEDNDEHRMIELVDGVIEVLPMPSMLHQRIAIYILRLIDAFVREHRLGEVLFAPLPVWLWEKHLREPDIVFLRSHHVIDPLKPPVGADLVMEIVSPDRRSVQRDTKDKRRAYAKAKIPEYWIVDPQKKTTTVLTLGTRAYKVHGKFKPGDQATSKLLSGFQVDVTKAFAAGLGEN